MKFRKRVKVFPGFTLNFSNAGVSSTIGIRGASINISKRGAYLNTGIPGTGLYDRQRIWKNTPVEHGSSNVVPSQPSYHIGNEILIGEIKSSDASELTSSSMLELKNTLEELFSDRHELADELIHAQKKLKSAKTRKLISQILIFGLIINHFENKVDEASDYVSDLSEQLNRSFVDIDIHFDNSLLEKHKALVSAFNKVAAAEKIWDITSAKAQNQVATRSAAGTVVTREAVRFKCEDIDIIKSTFPALHLENKNGGDLYIYPAFAISTNDRRTFALIDIKDLIVEFNEQQFIEQEVVPRDTEVIDKTWFKVNKNGSPDRRFVNNYEIPVVRYGQLDFTSSSGLNERYAVSNFEIAKNLFNAFKQYQS